LMAKVMLVEKLAVLVQEQGKEEFLVVRLLVVEELAMVE
ncbi:unnamed protein product, partial [marine sediment metagenome]